MGPLVDVGASSVVRQALKNIEPAALASALWQVPLSDDTLEQTASPPEGAPLNLAQWLVWLWLVRVLSFAVVLNAELKIEEGPASALKTALVILDALKLSEYVAPSAAAVAGGIAFKRLGPPQPDDSNS